MGEVPLQLNLSMTAKEQPVKPSKAEGQGVCLQDADIVCMDKVCVACAGSY